MTEDPPKPHIITWRAAPERSEWIRRRWYENNISFQASIDEAVDLLRGPNRSPRQVSAVVHNAINTYVAEHLDFSPFQPDDVKELARYIRDRLLGLSPTTAEEATDAT